MNRNNLWKFLFVLAVLAWSFYQMYPPVGRNLMTEFQDKAVRKDTNFTAIVQSAEALQKEHPDRTFGNLLKAAGTNDLTHYFPFFDVKGELNPNRAVLYNLQKQAAGKIRLGLDLQGGTSFVVEMDTNRLANSTNYANTDAYREAALAQAADVLRRRVDRLGVAEPVIQPQGNNQILVQLPGLSEADKDNAREQIQKVAFLEFSMVHEHSADLVKEGMTEPGYRVLNMKAKSQNGAPSVQGYLVRKTPELTGEHVKSAFVTRNQMGQPEI